MPAPNGRPSPLLRAVLAPSVAVALVLLLVIVSLAGERARAQEPDGASPAGGANEKVADELEKQLLDATDQGERLYVAAELFEKGQDHRLEALLHDDEASDEVKRAIIQGVALKGKSKDKSDAACALLWPIATDENAGAHAEFATDWLRKVDANGAYAYIRAAIQGMPAKATTEERRRAVTVCLRIFGDRDPRRATMLLVAALEVHEDTIGSLIYSQLRGLTGARHGTLDEWKAWLAEWEGRSNEEWLAAKVAALQTEIDGHRARVLAVWRDKLALLEERARQNPEDRGALDALLGSIATALKDAAYPEVQLEAVRELGILAGGIGLAPAQDPAVSQLLTLLEDRNQALALLAIDSLGGAKARPSEIASVLLPFAADEARADKSVTAIEALGRLGRAEVVPTLHAELVEALDARAVKRAVALVEALGMIGEDAVIATDDPRGSVAKLLIAVVVDGTKSNLSDENELLQAAVAALGRLRYEAGGAVAAEVVAVLTPVARAANDTERLRGRAVTALGHVPHPEAVEPLLTALDGDQSQWVKKAAIGSLGESPVRTEDLPRIFKSLAPYLNGGNSELRAQAGPAVKRIIRRSPDASTLAPIVELVVALTDAGLEAAALEYLEDLLPESAAKLEDAQRSDATTMDRYLRLKRRQVELLIAGKEWARSREVINVLIAGLRGADVLDKAERDARLAVASLLNAKAQLELDDPSGAAETLQACARQLDATYHARLWPVVLGTADRLADRRAKEAVKQLVELVGGIDGLPDAVRERLVAAQAKANAPVEPPPDGGGGSGEGPGDGSGGSGDGESSDGGDGADPDPTPDPSSGGGR